MEDVPIFARNNYDGVPEGVQVEPYEYIAIFDGHGGEQASEYASKYLLKEIISQPEFWSCDDGEIQGAIRKGFIDCHYNMWKASRDWPQSSPGIICTAGTTASVAFIRRGKVYVGHVGDSGIALGKINEYQNHIRATTDSVLNRSVALPASKAESHFEAMMLTKDHKPESAEEKERIEALGGEVRNKSGVYRVVWKRPMISSNGPSGLSLGSQDSDMALVPEVMPTPINPVPFLAVARSLGDFWSYEEEKNDFVVSPVPDVSVHSFTLPKHRCLIAGSDGLWNVIRPAECLDIVEETYRLQELWMWQCLRANKPELIEACDVNVAELLVRKVLNRCQLRKMRSDNVSIIIYYPAPSREKMEALMDGCHPEASLYPWLQDSDQGFAQYRHSLMHLQNMVSCIGQTKPSMSSMEMSFRIDMIGFAPRMRVNPLRDSPRSSSSLRTGHNGSFNGSSNGYDSDGSHDDEPELFKSRDRLTNGQREEKPVQWTANGDGRAPIVSSMSSADACLHMEMVEVDWITPQCALVLTKDDETVRIPAYELLGLESDAAAGTAASSALDDNGLLKINPLRRRTTDVLLSQRIKFLRTHSNNALSEVQEHSTAIMTNGQGQNGSAVKRIKVSTSTNTMSLSFFQGTVLENGTEAENEEEEGWQRPVSFVPLRSSCSLLQHLADTSSPAHLERW